MKKLVFAIIAALFVVFSAKETKRLFLCEIGDNRLIGVVLRFLKAKVI